MLKTALFDCVSMKNVAVLTKDWAFAFSFRPHPREFAIQGKKMLMPGGSPGAGAGRSWNWLMHNEPINEGHGLKNNFLLTQ